MSSAVQSPEVKPSTPDERAALNYEKAVETASIIGIEFPTLIEYAGDDKNTSKNGSKILDDSEFIEQGFDRVVARLTQKRTGIFWRRKTENTISIIGQKIDAKNKPHSQKIINEATTFDTASIARTVTKIAKARRQKTNINSIKAQHAQGNFEKLRHIVEQSVYPILDPRA